MAFRRKGICELYHWRDITWALCTEVVSRKLSDIFPGQRDYCSPACRDLGHMLWPAARLGVA